LNAQVLGISVDSVPSLKAWTETFGGISYPVLSDFYPHGAVAEKYGVLRSEGYSERAIFVIDDSGIIRYIDIHNIDEQPDNRVLFSEIKKLRPEFVEPEQQQRSDALPHGGVVMYCTRWCPDCRRARILFNQYNIDFTEVDVYAIPGADDQVRAWTGGSLITPTFDIDGQILIDYDEAKLRRILKIPT
jgi:glutaredoxin